MCDYVVRVSHDTSTMSNHPSAPLPSSTWAETRIFFSHLAITSRLNLGDAGFPRLHWLGGNCSPNIGAPRADSNNTAGFLWPSCSCGHWVSSSVPTGGHRRQGYRRRGVGGRRPLAEGSNSQWRKMSPPSTGQPLVNRQLLLSASNNPPPSFSYSPPDPSLAASLLQYPTHAQWSDSEQLLCECGT